MIYGAISMGVMFIGFIFWGLESGFFERLWEWNPDIPLEKKPSIPRAYTKKDNS